MLLSVLRSDQSERADPGERISLHIAGFAIDPQLVRLYRNGQYATLRLTPSMYHRFHAPYDCIVDKVTYISGDTWNVNPIALNRVAKLFCKNERAVICTMLRPFGITVTLVPVAAILVASIRLHFLDVLLTCSTAVKPKFPAGSHLAKAPPATSRRCRSRQKRGSRRRPPAATPTECRIPPRCRP